MLPLLEPVLAVTLPETITVTPAHGLVGGVEVEPPPLLQEMYITITVINKIRVDADLFMD